MADYLITTTADFNAGTKSDTDTITDNPLQLADQIGLSPTFCDRWAGGARKAGWTEDNDTGCDVVDETDQAKMSAHEHDYSHLERSPGVDNITIQGKLKIPNRASNAWSPSLNLVWTKDNWVRSWIANDSGTCRHCYCYCINNVVTYGYTGTPSWNTWFWYKVVLSSSNAIMYYSADGSSWTVSKDIGSRSSYWSGAPMIICGKGYSDATTYTNDNMDNSYSPVGVSDNWYMSDIVVTPYKSSGNWMSATITPHSYEKLKNIVVTLSNGDASNYITKVEIIKAADSSILSTCNTDFYTTDTLDATDFDNGFQPTANTPFKIKLYFVGDGTKTINVTELSGDMEEAYYTHWQNRFINQGGY